MSIELTNLCNVRYTIGLGLPNSYAKRPDLLIFHKTIIFQQTFHWVFTKK